MGVYKKNIVNRAFIWLITRYQQYLSPDHSPFSNRKGHCRFIPTCSEYSRICFEQKHWSIALLKTVWRIARCLPGRPLRIDIP